MNQNAELDEKQIADVLIQADLWLASPSVGLGPRRALKNACAVVRQLLLQREELRKDEMHWRYMLWLNHGCEPAALYGDDGEMQCGRCMMDFKRMSGADIAENIRRRGLERLGSGV
jgi:hypothetical protein